MLKFRLYLPIPLLVLSTVMLLCSWPKTLLEFSVASSVVLFAYLTITTTVFTAGILTVKGRDGALSPDEFWAKVNRRTAILSYIFGTIWLALIIASILLDTTWGQQLRILILGWLKSISS